MGTLRVLAEQDRFMEGFMEIILCHTTADFDTLGAAVGLTRLHPGARIVLSGGAHPAVRDFLALHRDEYALIERRAVNPDQIRGLWVVDTQWRDRLGNTAPWLDLPNLDITLYDHHETAAAAPTHSSDIPATRWYLEPVGATSTIIVEHLQQAGLDLTPIAATVMALGIHVDTGSLTFDHTSVRDARALTWLMEQGANLRAIAEYVEPGLSPALQDLLTVCLANLQSETVQGHAIASILLDTEAYTPGLSSLASHLTYLTESDVLILAARYGRSETDERVTVIGRSRGGSLGNTINLSALFQPWGGGGHPKAAALSLRTRDPAALLAEILANLRQQIPAPPTARQLMSSPVRTIRPETTIEAAQRVLLRYGHSGLSVVDDSDQLVGVISRRDLDIALHHGFSHAPVKGYMTTNLKTITPDTPLPEIESLMVTYDIGRLPVLENGQMVGIVTRTDVLRQLHQGRLGQNFHHIPDQRACPLPEVIWQMLGDRLSPPLLQVLQEIAEAAATHGWQLYMVGGAVRDLLLGRTGAALMPDIDLVVDGFHSAADQAAGVALARALQQRYPNTRLQIHGRFQTAALLWHHDPQLDSLWIDIATARTEFYPYPAANPEVEASSIRQDLYRRDFTINALAIRLTPPRQGELLDFFGGLLDLRDRQIRVLHANSFIEDPTRIYRAVRFAVRLGFEIEPQTEGYIRHAIASGIYHRLHSEGTLAPALQTRLKRELHYILEAPYWKTAIRLLAELDALRCIHPSLHLSNTLWSHLKRGDRWLKRFDPDLRLEHWQVLLEVLLSHLEPGERGRIARGLQLPVESCDRLQQLETLEASLTADLTPPPRPSQIVHRLNRYDLPTLALVSVRAARPLRRLIWRYLTYWSQIKPPLDGNDLKRLGYKPGKQFKQILDTLLTATLDGELAEGRSPAEAYVQSHFPPAP